MEKFNAQELEVDALKVKIEEQQTVINEQRAEISRLNSVVEKLSCHDDKRALSPTQKSEDKLLDKPSMILLVEDHYVAEKVTRNMLTVLHCQIDVAMDGKMALELLKTRHYDLVFMDVGLPDMNGGEITRRIRAHELTKGTHIPIIALTAHSDSKTQQSCLDAGMNAVANKPLCREEAEKILTAFIPARKKWLERHFQEVFLEEDVVDLEQAKELLGSDEAELWKTLAMFVESLPYEAKKLEEAYQHENWDAISAIANKLKGGASYCGMLRLKSICTELDNYIRAGLTTQLGDFFEKMLFEIGALQKLLKAKMTNGKKV